jgi:hypothetical protein
MQAERPFSTAVFAASAPAGPPPTMRRSYLFFMHSLQGADRAYLCAYATTGTAVLDGEICIDQFKSALRAN